jgi:hypothetical protein
MFSWIGGSDWIKMKSSQPWSWWLDNERPIWLDDLWSPWNWRHYRWPVTPMSSSPRWWRHILIDLYIDYTKMIITWSILYRFGRMTPHFASARRARCNCTGPKWRKYVIGYRIFMKEFSYEKNSYLHMHCSSYCVSLALVHIGHVGGIWYVV